jgi:hypothetical protein
LAEHAPGLVAATVETMRNGVAGATVTAVESVQIAAHAERALTTRFVTSLKKVVVVLLISFVALEVGVMHHVANEAERPDSSSTPAAMLDRAIIPRTIAKEWCHEAKLEYGLQVFGPKAASRFWIVNEILRVPAAVLRGFSPRSGLACPSLDHACLQRDEVPRCLAAHFVKLAVRPRIAGTREPVLGIRRRP